MQLAETGYNFHFTDASFKKAIMTQATAPHLSALTRAATLARRPRLALRLTHVCAGTRLPLAPRPAPPARRKRLAAAWEATCSPAGA